ncbi:hypothetical protein AM202_0811 [Actinobacillus minor 202]|uniref:KAP NTPase domain-containing protein n=1 Tax=Actinobacillus minor 202 TaxID=591023 RepID=A0ABM9YJ47_9PAST|nr:P-loop NTPase fold protein [Actinobacillus minor]EER48313.1 hypothetical protein AM202_0811 [Actinobacillus minor 202]
MANVENLEKRLHSLINKSQSYGSAIALTGEWGIGKTHFWKDFYENNADLFEMKKYAYVSLFGLNSLDELKYQIFIQTHDGTQEKNISSIIKNFLSKIEKKLPLRKTLEDSALPVIPGIVNYFISNSIENLIICIDDFERKSDKLDTKEVMGLINFLKEEKNCTIITILHEDKLQSEEFKEYKEKVFNEVLVLDQNISIIQEVIKDNEIFAIYEDFYNKLKIKNLRFYQKVHQYYEDIVKLRDDFTFSSKEHILKNLLFISLIHEKGNITLSYDKNGEKKEFLLNLELIINFDNEEFSDHLDKALSITNFLNNFMTFYSLDEWGKLIAQNLTMYELDDSTLEHLIDRDKINEKDIQNDITHRKILDEYYSLLPNPNFSERVYELACNMIPKLNIHDLTFYYNVLKTANIVLANKLEKQIKNHIEEHIRKFKSKDEALAWKNKLVRFGIEDRFFLDFIEESINSFENKYSKDDFYRKFLSSFSGDNIDSRREIANKLDKNSLKAMLWGEIIDSGERRRFIRNTIQHPLFSENHKEKVRKWAIEILKEKIEENPDSKVPIEMWLEQTKDLTEFQ